PDRTDARPPRGETMTSRTPRTPGGLHHPETSNILGASAPWTPREDRAYERFPRSGRGAAGRAGRRPAAGPEDPLAVRGHGLDDARGARDRAPAAGHVGGAGGGAGPDVG